MPVTTFHSLQDCETHKGMSNYRRMILSDHHLVGVGKLVLDTLLCFFSCDFIVSEFSDKHKVVLYIQYVALTHTFTQRAVLICCI